MDGAGSGAVMSTALVAGLLAGYAIAIPVGAVGAYLVSLTARTSMKVGVGAAMGVATADGGYALLAVAGGAALARVIQPLSGPLRLISAALLIALAVRGSVLAVRGWRAHRTGAELAASMNGGRVYGPWRAYLVFVGITALNPATVVYFAALVMGEPTVVSATPAQAAVFVTAAFLASASWQLVLAAGGAALGRVLTGVTGRTVTALLSSALITALAVRLVVAG